MVHLDKQTSKWYNWCDEIADDVLRYSLLKCIILFLGYHDPIQSNENPHLCIHMIISLVKYSFCKFGMMMLFGSISCELKRKRRRRKESQINS